MTQSKDLLNTSALYDAVRGAVGRSIEDPTPVYLGYLDASGAALVKIADPAADEIGLVYYTESYSEDLSEAHSVGRAYNTGIGALSDDELVFGAPIYIRRDSESGDWHVAGKRPRAAAGFIGTQGKRIEYPGVIVPQTGLLDSLQPETMQAVVYGAPYTLDGDFKWIDTLYVDDQTGNIPGTDGQANYVLVEVDFTNEILTYVVGSTCDASLTHLQAWAIDAGTGTIFPQADQTKFRAGYIKLVSGMTAITRSLIWAVQEIITKTSAGGGGGGGTLFVLTDQPFIFNTTAETSLLGAGIGSLTIPIGWFSNGRGFRVRLYGALNTRAAAAGDLTIHMTIGGLEVYTLGSFTLPNGYAGFGYIDMELFAYDDTDPANIQVRGNGIAHYGNGINPPTMAEWMNGGANYSVDGTITNVIDITATFSDADNDNTIGTYGAVISEIPAP